MKKIKALIVVSLLIVLPIITLRTCERSRLMRGLDAQSKQLDALLDKEQHNGPGELGKALNTYLIETSFVLNHQGLLFGNYFSSRDRQIIFDNACRRLARVKTMLLTNPSFFHIQLPDLDNVVNLFYEKLGTASYNNKDQVIKDILKRWADSGEMASLYMTKDELRQHEIIAVEAQKIAEDKKWEQILAKNKERNANKPEIPGMEDVQKLKQREVIRVTTLSIPFDKLDEYLGQKMTFSLKNGRLISGKSAGSDGNLILIDFSTEGSPLVMKIPSEQIAKIEMITKEKILEMYDPGAEHEAQLKPGFQELDYSPYPTSKEYIGIVTTDNKMFFVSATSGTLTCHSRENREGYRPMATRIAENWPNDVLIYSQFQVHTGNNTHMDSETSNFSQSGFYKSLDDAASAGNALMLFSKKLNDKLHLVFELRLIKEVPGAAAPIIIFHKDLVLNEKTIRLMIYA
ncbi:MAG: hypothetical protein NTW95_07475, partial [Candidatus Aminicenantes bacterium]|nr:hypothetical protein [Candidatus Aminicenantes bacterium]